ncbi:MAG: DUF799 family lipoprotein [Deltaproteobacteria bacterium]|nr:DUF799 family lipoprotein [Deltaproteobacteria bacterium]
MLCTLAGCAYQEQDYSKLFASNPRSILVAPVRNDTTNLDSPEVVEAVVTRPLAERGYYVFPLILTDALFKDLGLSEAGHVQELQPQRFRELFGADAVLFVVITDWGSKYMVMDAAVVVEMDFTLYDTRSGEELWRSSQRVQQSTGTAGSDPIAALIGAAIGYVLNETFEPNYRPLAAQAARQAFDAPRSGLPLGPYSPQHGADRAAYPAP